MDEPYCEQFCFVFHTGKPSDWMQQAKEWGITPRITRFGYVDYLDTLERMAEYAYHADVNDEREESEVRDE